MNNGNDNAMKEHLGKDPILSDLVARYGPLTLTPSTDYFDTLLDSIVSQQLSSKAANTIMGRIRALVPHRDTPDPESILALDDQTLRDAGLSWQKVSYVKDLAKHVQSGELDLAHIASMEDEEIIKELVAVRGIGRWTAEMFLIFSLARPDVFDVDDYCIQAAIKRLYKLDALPKPALMRQIAEPWRPYRSYASLYLWRTADTNSPKVDSMFTPS